jgi:hypothetical protein
MFGNVPLVGWPGYGQPQSGHRVSSRSLAELSPNENVFGCRRRRSMATLHMIVAALPP